MTKVDEIRKAARNKWKEFLAAEITGTSFLPWYYKGAKSDKKACYETQRKIAELLITNSKDYIGKGYKLKTAETSTKLYGTQSEIIELYADEKADFIYLAGKEKEYKNFINAMNALDEFASKNNFSLKEWEKKNIAELEKDRDEVDFFHSLLLSLKWLLDNPDSKIYIREIPVSVHSKFIENNSKLLASLYSEIKSVEPNDDLITLCGLKEKEALIRFRISSIKREETAIPLSAFNNLDKEIDLSDIKRAIVIENEIVYLTFPQAQDSLVIFGSGFQATLLQNAHFLDRLKLFYFGDIDEHGFMILSLFRKAHTKTKSFLMDKATYEEFSIFSVKGSKENSDITEENLTEEEIALLHLLKKSKDNNRLEQERISQAYIISKLSLYLQD